MSLLIDLLSQIFKNQTAATSHLSATFDGLAAKRSENLNWRDSVVDLMKLLGMDNSLDDREKLAVELGFTGDVSDSAILNMWLHTRLVIKVVENHAVDVAAILDGLAAKNSENLNWRRSVVDLMKLLGMDSSLADRQRLARQLGYTRDLSDSATMNMWLHRRLIAMIVDNGGTIPDIPGVDITSDRPVFNGRPAAAFAGALPYASEIFGVYKPLAGWFGRSNTQRVASAIGTPQVALLRNEAFFGDSARNLTDNTLALIREVLVEEARGVLSPVGLVNLFRQYFFEFDTFLGAPVGHLWISPGGTVEVVESSTRRTLVEKSAEVFEELTRKTEETLTTQEDLADAVKEDNANDTKLGASASAGANFAGIYQADASASFSAGSSTKQSSEETHKHSRNQSSKVASEIRRNFKTTFKTVTESTDTTSRRYVVQNTTSKLVNYDYAARCARSEFKFST